MARECRCSCDAFAWVLRVVTLLAYLALMAAAGWGFPLAHKRFTAQTTVNGTSTLNNVDQVLNQLSGLSSNFAFFQGVMSVYFFVFGAVGVLSELRTKCLRETVLARLAFLLSWFGRGSFALYVGASCPRVLTPSTQWRVFAQAALPAHVDGRERRRRLAATRTAALQLSESGCTRRVACDVWAMSVWCDTCSVDAMPLPSTDREHITGCNGGCCTGG